MRVLTQAQAVEHWLVVALAKHGAALAFFAIVFVIQPFFSDYLGNIVVPFAPAATCLHAAVVRARAAGAPTRLVE